jgi:uncharacterized protein involved in type VI secretion and phage assembly
VSVNGQGPPFYGKYRGIVTDNNDKLELGRLRAKLVQDIFGDKESGWAMPCTPYAGKGVGLFLIPPKDAWVWIEFEHGDPDYPIWTGCFWGDKSEVPAKDGNPEIKVLKTGIGTITVNDSQDASGITIETTKGMKVVIDKNGIQIINGQKVQGQDVGVKISDTKVSLNGNGLEVS